MRKRNRGRLSQYLDELIYGANDGIVTTFAVVAGASGAMLGSTTIIILGLANLLADGFSMGASSFLAIRTEADVKCAEGGSCAAPRAMPRSLSTFGGFVLAGALPLLPFLFPLMPGNEFAASSVAACAAFFLVGAARSFVTKRSFLASGMEMLIVGGCAALIAYGVGYLLKNIVGV